MAGVRDANPRAVGGEAGCNEDYDVHLERWRDRADADGVGISVAADSGPTSFTSTTAFDNRHRVVASDGPRTDVQDVTSATYFPDGDANLARRGGCSG